MDEIVDEAVNEVVIEVVEEVVDVGEEVDAVMEVVDTTWLKSDADEVIVVVDVGTSGGDVGIDGRGSALDETSGANSAVTTSGVWGLAVIGVGTFGEGV